MGIKIIKEMKARDYTFIDDGLNLEKSTEKKGSSVKKGRIDRDYRLRDDVKLNNLKHKSKITGGHNMQGHSAVYE
jgi:hypothetical protein